MSDAISHDDVDRVARAHPYVRPAFVIRQLGIEDTRAARIHVGTILSELGWTRPSFKKPSGKPPSWRRPEVEPLMKFWNVRRLAEQFHLSRITVGKLLSSLGAKKWTDSGGHRSAVWYWEDEP